MPDLLNRLQQALADRYAIERELGAGGMATVYLAEDLRHHRKVALKVLRPEIAATIGAGRFAREIEVAARLQHPNIVPLLDSGEAAGFFFYVMPFIEGESLRDRLARSGALAIPDAVRILIEVADALAHAHAHGVVHRDIKPGNVLLSGRHALVADFGVAKAVTEATGHQMLTSAGVALGTPAYMAPEQAVADSRQDHRVDIYALGVLGYELLTGRSPFSATTAQDMLAAHITTDPEPLEQHRPTVSPALSAVVMKCLAKKPADRWQTADELLHSLELFATPSSGTTPAQMAPADATRRLPRWVPWATGLAGVAVVILVLSQILKARPLNIAAADMTQVTNGSGVAFQPVISPDGNEVAYVAGPIAAPHLLVRSTVNVAGGAAVRLSDTSFGSEWLPAWSPDGQSVRFLGCSGGLNATCTWREVGRLGGAAQPVPLPSAATAPAWSSNGTRVAFVRDDTIFALSDIDTTLQQMVPAVPAEPHSLAWSPDGRLIAFVNGNPGWDTGANIAGSSVWVVSAVGGEPRKITNEEHLNASPAWLDDRHLLFVSDRDGQRAVYVVEVGPRGARGEPRSIPGLADPHSISYSASSGRLAYAKFTIRQNIWSYPLGRPAPVSVREGRPVTTGSLLIETHDVSPDGRWIAYSTNVRGHMDLYKIPVEGGQPVPLTNSAPGGEAPRWSPDGREIVFHTTALATSEVELVPADGGPALVVSSGPQWAGWPTWGTTGREILFVSNESGRWTTLEASRERPGGPWRSAVPVALRGVQDAAPDGRGYLCRSGSTLELRTRDGGLVWHRDLAATDGLKVTAAMKGSVRFSRDGRAVYVFATREGRRGVWSVPLSGGAARLVVAFDDPAIVPFGWFSVGPDRLYLTVSEYQSDIWVAKLRY